MRGPGEWTSPMMLEIALDADEEWDSSRSWQSLARNAPRRRSPKAPSRT